MVLRAILAAGFLLGASSNAFAEDKAIPELREAFNCFPAEGIVKFLSKFEKLDADKRDTARLIPTASFTVNDGGALPDRFFSRDNEVEASFTISPDGAVTDFDTVTSRNKTAELCIEDQARVGTPKDGNAMAFSIDTDIVYIENTGYHDMATLKDGLKDGKTHYKKMAPAPLRMMMPKMSHVMIVYEEEDVTPQFAAMKGQTPMKGLTSDQHCEQTIIKIEDLEELGADGLRVSGGAYTLMPVPNKKMLEKFANCEEDEGETKKDDK